eukprot:Clim_evm11s8 gene=Clim_evmTU11s8
MQLTPYLNRLHEVRKQLGVKKRDYPASVHLCAGATSSGISCVVLQPFDVIKTRLQGTTDPIKQSIKGVSQPKLTIRGAIGRIASDAGIGGFWRGVLPSLYRTVPGVGLYFTILQRFKARVVEYNRTQGANPHLTISQSLGVSAIARTFVGVLMLPPTVLKTRYESGLFNYRSFSAAVIQIYRNESWHSLYRGGTATVLRDTPFSALYYISYEWGKRTLKALNQSAIEALDSDASPAAVGQSEKGLPVALQHFTAGINAGLFATAVTHPADVVKTRIQVYPEHYRGTWSTAVRLVREEGIKALYSGFWPRTIKRTLMSAITWTIYEEIVHSYATLLVDLEDLDVDSSSTPTT